jgi:5-oxoprolinase (ATP-hydrolysing) subunit A
MRIDINCDLGEGMGTDKDIIPFITSANIACGYHAGDTDTMWATIEYCIANDVAIGAHPSFLDRANFGRTELQLSPEEIYELIIQQLIIIDELLSSFETPLRHVKPHGALYNLSAKNADTAHTIAKAIKNYNSNLVLVGQSGSHSISEAKKLGLQTASEVFADRTYQDDGYLTPRSVGNALISDTDKVSAQVLQMVKEGTVTSVSGKTIPITAETICIHGDGKYAVEFAKAIHNILTQSE